MFSEDLEANSLEVSIGLPPYPFPQKLQCISGFGIETYGGTLGMYRVIRGCPLSLKPMKQFTVGLNVWMLLQCSE